MPGYPWLAKTSVQNDDIAARMRALQVLGVPYTEPQIVSAPEALKGKTEEDALIAYLQGLGTALRGAQTQGAK
jgi:cytochrome c oxidase cbb3-type subunit 2